MRVSVSMSGGGGRGDMTNISLIMVLLFVRQGAGCAGGLTEMAQLLF